MEFETGDETSFTMKPDTLSRGFWLTLLGIIALTGFVIAGIRMSAAVDNGQWQNQPPEVRAWYKNAQLTEVAKKRLNFSHCCDHADVVRTSFRVTTTDEWWYLVPLTGEWKQVPPDIIHWFDSAPKGEPTLFIYNGVETCFYPPQGGV